MDSNTGAAPIGVLNQLCLFQFQLELNVVESSGKMIRIPLSLTAVDQFPKEHGPSETGLALSMVLVVIFLVSILGWTVSC